MQSNPDSDRNPSAALAGSARETAAGLMRRQAALSIRVAAAFIVLILAIPLMTQFAPALAQHPVLGFPLSWLILGILFYPITWALSWYFVNASEKLEHREAETLRDGGTGG
jgi:uncharacterized membrane protein (DUF485 family)